jgi:flagellar motor protein MotB
MRQKKEQSEWVGIGDLMAGVIGVMVLMLVYVMLLVQDAEGERQDEASEQEKKFERVQKLNQGLVSQLGVLKTELGNAKRIISGYSREDSLIAIQADDLYNSFPSYTREAVQLDRVSIFLDEKSSFKSGEYCVSDKLDLVLKGMAPKLKEFLEKNRNRILVIEGHADPDAILSPPRMNCGYPCVVKNNVDLALCRALQAKRIIINASEMTSEFSERIGVISYGYNKRRGSYELDRRVEIRIEPIEY